MYKTIDRSPEIDGIQANVIHAPDTVAVRVDHQQWETLPNNSQSMIIQHNGPISHQHKQLGPTTTITAHSIQSSQSDIVEPVQSSLNSPSASPIGQVSQQHQEDVVQQISPSGRISTELSRANSLNGYIFWPQRVVSSKTPTENLILSYLESDEQVYKQSDVTGADHHYYHGNELH